MSPDDRKDRVERLFLEAIDRPLAQRDELLAAEPDLAVRDEVRSLLAHHDAPGDATPRATLLDSKDAPGRMLRTGVGFPPAAAFDEPTLPPGAVIGRYTILGVIGAGGMGVVYVAEQDRPRRRVALKVLRAAIASARMLRRFEYEAEVLGRLQHPGIAQVYEAGTFTEGRLSRPFIAMELIAGLPLVEHAQKAALPIRARVELLAKVADAVQHAHQSGVIHRDLKPANIIISPAASPAPALDATPPPSHPAAASAPGAGDQPKILDFGVARGLTPDGPDAHHTTAHTAVGQIIGTLPYMSPEQLDARAAGADSRSDIYALGVIGYELLTGRLPLNVASLPLPEAARRIHDDQPERLSRIDRQLRGDLDTIIAKALAKDPQRRYPSASEFAADLRRFLAGEPISARQDSAVYVLRAQIRKHKALVAGLCMGVVGLVTFAVYAAFQADAKDKLAIARQQETTRARIAQTEALAQKERADDNARRLESELTSANLERGRLLGAAGSLRAAEDLLWPAFLRNIASHHTFYALWEMYSHQPCLASIAAHAQRAIYITAAPSGDLLASVGDGDRLIVYDARERRPLWRAATDADLVRCAFTHDGQSIFAAARDGTVLAWDARSGSPRPALHPALGPNRSCLAIATHPLSTTIALGFRTGAIKLLEPDGRPIAEVSLASDAIQTLAWSPDGLTLAVGTASGRLRLYAADLASFRELAEPANFAVNNLAFSPSGAFLALGGTQDTFRIYDPRSGRLVADAPGRNGSITGVAWGPTDDTLYTCGWWRLTQWSVPSLSITRQVGLVAGDAWVVREPNSGLLWLTSGAEVRVWDLESCQGRVEYPPDPARSLVRYLPDGRVIAGFADGRVELLDPRTGRTAALVGRAGTRRVRSIAVSPDGRLAATNGFDRTLRIWDLEALSLVEEWPRMHSVSNCALAFSPDGAAIVSPAADGSFQVRKVPSGEVLLTIPNDGFEPIAAVFSPDGSRIATTTRRGPVMVYSAADGAVIASCTGQGTPWRVLFSPDGESVIATTWTHEIQVWNARTGELRRRLTGHASLVTDAAFRPREDNILCSSSADGTIRLWDLAAESNTPILSLEPPGGLAIWTLDLCPKHSELVCTDTSGTTHRYLLRWFNQHIEGNLGSKYGFYKDQVGGRLSEVEAGELAQALRRGTGSIRDEFRKR